MRIKTFIFTIAFLCIGQINSNAQDVNREIGISFSNFTDFGALYKKQVSENKWLRLRVISTNLSLNNTSLSNNSQFSFGLNIGKEKRKPVGDQLQFLHGINFGLGGTYTKLENSVVEENVERISPFISIRYQLALQTQLSDQFFVVLQTFPGISFRPNFSSERDTEWNANIGFNSSAASLALLYRFSSPKKIK